jgi:hypothetical protein
MLMLGGVSLAAIARQPVLLANFLPPSQIPIDFIDTPPHRDLQVCGGMLVILSLLCLKSALSSNEVRRVGAGKHSPTTMNSEMQTLADDCRLGR